MANNPAGRLLVVLQRAIESTNLHNHPALIGWGDLLKCEAGNHRQMFRRFALLLECAEEAKTEMVAIYGKDASMYVGWVAQLYQMWQHWNFATPLSQFIVSLPQIMNPIQVCDHQLSQQRPEPTIDQAQLDKWLATVRGMIDEISIDQTLPHHVLEYLLRQLMTVEQALIDYRFMGIAAIRVAVEQTIGTARMSPDAVADAKATPHGKQFAQVMGAIFLALIVTHKAVRTAIDAKKLCDLLLEPAVDVGESADAVLAPRLAPALLATPNPSAARSTDEMLESSNS